ncbi:MAG: tetratricopeptide repeat protein [Candidatus Heimdallarchaeota archaeon]|nr:tetratricopeptide repeat protein [Candidatus Heimdallarchaeota archaeon]
MENKFQEFYTTLDYNGLVTLANDILQAQEDNYEAIFYKAFALHQTEKYEEFLELAIPLVNNDLMDIYIARTLKELSRYFILHGKYMEGMRISYKVLTIAEYFNKTDLIAGTLNNIGVVYAIRGEYEKALENYTKAFEIKNADGHETLSVRLNMAILKRKLGRNQEALNDFMDLDKNPEESHSYRAILYNAMVYTLIKIGQREKSKQFLEKYKKMLQHVDPVRYNYYNRIYHYLQALVLISSNRLTDKSKAVPIILECIADDDLINENKNVLIKKLIEFRLIEYSFNQEEDIFLDIIDLNSQYIEFAKSENIYDDIINGNILKSELAMIQGDFDSVIRIHEEIERFIEDNELYHFLDRLEKERNKMKTSISNMRALIEKGSKIIDRIELLNIEHYLHIIKNLDDIKT